MRLWTLHPKYLDARGLVALWREGLLAQAVLLGETRGYKHHPQLVRFSEIAAIAEYLRIVHAESVCRGYNFAAGKIHRSRKAGLIPVTRGQVEFEWNHLMSKLAKRDPVRQAMLKKVKRPAVHPLFRVVPGDVEGWEKVYS
jgi:hypothetical protein